MTDFLYRLEAIIQDRKQNPTGSSYTNKLLSEGMARMAQKVGEEGVEVAIAALAQGRTEQIGEISDLMYHTLVMMAALDITLDDVSAELERRHSKR
ncbi:MAG: phosphoribosyl-ATP diphosphatase [Pleurocapsa minor GSE-CHR-MK-17-07R]|jgi:phosphoribosyl-ATP pyrophosphohydrolase/phosphoribosyl-AMP cyclohydrolase|nr:phosphoribosyl-ATP diphosphatase [Pleurocapsa minor GSE-CHR-MK 17-07R]